MTTGLVLLAVAATLAGEHGTWPPPEKMESLEMTSRWVAEMEKSGRPRAETAQWLSEVLDERVVNMNSPERMTLAENWIPFGSSDPNSADARFGAWRDQNEFDYEKTATWAWDNRVGQCSEHASMAYYVLKKAGVSGNFRILTAPRHEFVAWGLPDGADPNNPGTWGADAIIVDGWIGDAIPPIVALQHAHFKGKQGGNPIQESTNLYDPSAPRWKTTGGGSSADCFVATAAFGTPLAAEVQVLRDFRDRSLRTTRAGRAAVSWYGEVGPRAAAVIRTRPRARAWVRAGLRPLVDLLRTHREAWDPEAR